MRRTESECIYLVCSYLACDCQGPGHLTLIRNDFDAQVAAPWPVKLAEEDALPATQNQAPVLDQQRLGATDDCGFQVGITIAVVVEVGSVLWSQPFQEIIKVLL